MDSEQGNLLLGFAWKTDATIPQDHPAYYMWHELADRRYGLELPLFAGAEVSATLTAFSRELGQSLNPMLRRQLEQACQGYPWLLKKLCIHVKSLLDSGLSQIQVSDRGLDVEALFQRDLSDLNPDETRCLKEVARRSPASFVEVVEEFGAEVITSLVTRRILVRSGDRLNPYWDILGDYLRTDVVPVLPYSYLPGTEFKTFFQTWVVVHVKLSSSVPSLAVVLRMREQSVRNVVRDLAKFGLIERTGEGIRSPLAVDIGQAFEEATAVLLRHLQSHVFTIALRQVAIDDVVTDDLLDRAIRLAFPTVTYRPQTWKVYSQRLAKYLSAVGILARSNGNWTPGNGTDSDVLSPQTTTAVLGRSASGPSTATG